MGKLSIKLIKENFANTKKFSRPRKITLQQIELANKKCIKRVS